MFSLQSAESICRTLGERVRQMRLARNLSQRELAEMTAASLSSVRRFEANGQGTFGLVVRVAQALQATQALDALFDESNRTIAQAEAAQRLARRQRARKPAATAQRRG